MAYEVEGISHMAYDELAARLQDEADQLVVIDVREYDEYIAGHIPGVPLIPMGEIPNCVESLDKSREYVFICRSGRRSFDVARFCKFNGIDLVHNYDGGMLGWQGEVADGPENIAVPFEAERLERKRQS